MNRQSTPAVATFLLILAPAAAQDWTSVPPLEDTWVGADDEHATHSTSPTLALRGPMSKYDAKEAYMRFDVPAISNVSGVALRIQRENLTGDNVLEVSVLPDQDVDGLTWATRPSGGTVIGSWSVAAGSGTEMLDVTGGITLGAKQVLRLRLVDGANSWGWGWVRSMEHGEASTRPSLEIESIGLPHDFGCGFIEEGPGDCDLVWRQNTTGELYELTDYGSFSVGCQISVLGWANDCNFLWDCAECNTCPGIEGCIWVLESVICPDPQPFDGCGALLQDPDCDLVFRPDGSDHTYGLDDTGGYSAGCRVLVSGTMYETPCECTYVCMGSEGCIEVDAIDICPDAGCYDSVVTITEFEVTEDTDPPANCPDPYVDITLTSDTCVTRKFHSPTDKGVCEGDPNSHQGKVFVAKDTRPTSVAWKAMDRDKGWFNDDDRMDESGFSLTPLEDENCGSHSGPAAFVEVCVEQNCSSADAGYSTVERELPLFVAPGQVFDVFLTLEVSGAHGSLVVLEELPEHFTFIDAWPSPTGGGPMIDDGGDELGFLLVWDVSGLADGDLAQFQYTAQAPSDPQQFLRGFGTAVVQDGLQVVSGQDLEDTALGGVLYDCNGNGVDDSADIANGTSQDADWNGVPDECEPCGTVYCDTNVADIAIDTCDGSAGSIHVDLSNGPPNQFAYLLVGDGNAVVSDPPGAIGDLCVVGGGCLGRYEKDLGLISGAGTFSTDIQNSPSKPCGGGVTFTPGSTWNFQYWHRLPMGQPSTFSKAIRVTFQ